MHKSMTTLLCLLGLLLTGLTAQTPITIGTGNSTDYKLPIFCEQNYSYSQSIYLKSEIGNGVTISKIAFQYTGTTWDQNLKVYMGNTAKSEFASTYPNLDWVPLSSMTEVFNGAVTASSGWVEITLSTPFVYDGVANLVVAVDENSEYASDEGDDFYGSATTTKRSMLRVGGSDINPSDAQLSGSSYKAIANIQLFPQSATPVLMVNPTAIEFPNTPTDSQYRMKKVEITNFGAGTLSVTNRADIAVTGTDAACYTIIDSLNFPLNLASGQKAHFYVKFTPFTSGYKNAALSITTQGDKGVHADCVTLYGYAYHPYKTAGSANGVGYAESFDSYLATNGAYYNDWYLEWGSSGLAAHTGTQSIYVPAGYTLGAVSPRMEVVATDSMSFFLQRAEAVTSASVRVAYTLATNPLTNTYTNLAVFNLADIPVLFADATSKKTISLAACAGQKVYIAFIGTSAGASTRLDDVSFFGSPNSIGTETLPKTDLLLQNYPNPFNPSTTISYELRANNYAKLAVYNAKGELVRSLVDGMQNVGKYSINFDGSGLNSGVYFYKLETNGKSVVNKMMLIK